MQVHRVYCHSNCLISCRSQWWQSLTITESSHWNSIQSNSSNSSMSGLFWSIKTHIFGLKHLENNSRTVPVMFSGCALVWLVGSYIVPSHCCCVARHISLCIWLHSGTSVWLFCTRSMWASFVFKAFKHESPSPPAMLAVLWGCTSAQLCFEHQGTNWFTMSRIRTQFHGKACKTCLNISVSTNQLTWTHSSLSVWTCLVSWLAWGEN